MKKIFLIFAGICLGVSMAEATEFRIKQTRRGDSKIDFPYGTVNGTTYWTQTEYNNVLAQLAVFSGTTTAAVAILITPSQFEFNLSTCVLSGFVSPDDFLAAQTYKGILPYLDELEIRIQSMNRVGGHAGQRADIQARLDYLSSQAKTLP